MGYALAMSACIGCGQIFSYNPMRVPSLTVKGTREPICQRCVDVVNPQRIKKGLQPIVPHADAYTACHEDELE